MKWLIKILIFFDEHPMDWIAHGILGIIIFGSNLFLIRLIDSIFHTPLQLISMPIALLASCNFVIAVELTQWDIFGMDRKRLKDTIIDLVADGIGIGLGAWLLT